LSKKTNKPKVPSLPNRSVDPADLAREADKAFEQAVKGGKGLVVGFDGFSHMTPPQLQALKKKERMHLNLRASDGRIKRRKKQAQKLLNPLIEDKGQGGQGQGKGDGEGGDGCKPLWYARPRKAKKLFSKQEVKAMLTGNDKEALRNRKSRLRALQDAKVNNVIKMRGWRMEVYWM
jgi:hypothetical protein